jgi:hypothetical protein
MTRLEPSKWVNHPWLLRAIAIVFVALAIAGIFSYSQGKNSALANQRADQLVALFQARGLPVPANKESIVRVFGDDGGAMCESPSSALKRALYSGMLMNGAAGPGARPVKVSRSLVDGELLALGVYCPSQVDDFQRFVNDQHYADVIRK